MTFGTTWGAGFDSPNERAYYLTKEDVLDWLTELERRAADETWLKENADRIYQVLVFSVDKPPVYTRAVKALCRIVAFMMLVDDNKRWMDLLLTALNRASDLKDGDLLSELYSLISQGNLLSDDVKSARQALYNALERITFETDDEKTLLAYLALFRIETHEYTPEFHDERVVKALALAESANNALLTALLYQALCGVYAHHSELEPALRYGQAALTFWQSQGNDHESAKTALMMTAAYRTSGRIDDARAMMNVARTYRERVHGQHYRALIDYEQAVMNYYAGDYASAEALLKDCFTGFREAGWLRYVAMSHHMLGLVYMELKDFHQAQTNLSDAFEQWKLLNHTYEQANVRYDMADLAFRLGDVASARACLAESRTLCAQVPPMTIRSYLESLIDELWQRTGDA